MEWYLKLRDVVRSKSGRRVLALVLVWILAAMLCLDGLALAAPGRASSFTASAATTASGGRTENLLFVGDSLTYNPEHVSKTYSKHGHQVFAAVGATIPQFYGLTTKKVTIGMKGYYVTGTLAGRNCNGICVLLGTNDVVGQSAATVFNNYKKLLTELQGKFDVPIYVMRLLPVNSKFTSRYTNYTTHNSRITALNAKLSQYCAATEGLYYIDATNGFVSSKGMFLHDYGDGLHMHPNYYNQFYNNIIEAIGNLAINEPEPEPDPEYYDESHLDQHWAYGAIQYNLERGLFKGYPDGYFYPNVKITRGMFVTVLGRAAEVNPEDYPESPFTDVAKDYYAAPYIAWAASKGIVQGTNAEGTIFEPDQVVTREQMAAIMDRYLKEKGDTTNLAEIQSLSEMPYRDAGDISGYATGSVWHCTVLKLLMGNQNQEFLPKESATRAQAATVLMRLQQYLEGNQ